MWSTKRCRSEVKHKSWIVNTILTNSFWVLENRGPSKDNRFRTVAIYSCRLHRQRPSVDCEGGSRAPCVHSPAQTDNDHVLLRIESSKTKTAKRKSTFFGVYRRKPTLYNVSLKWSVKQQPKTAKWRPITVHCKVLLKAVSCKTEQANCAALFAEREL